MIATRRNREGPVEFWHKGETSATRGKEEGESKCAEIRQPKFDAHKEKRVRTQKPKESKVRSKKERAKVL